MLFYLVYITVLCCILATSISLSSVSPFLSTYLSSTFFSDSSIIYPEKLAYFKLKNVAI